MTPTIIAKGVKASESLREYITDRLDSVLVRTQKWLPDITIRLIDSPHKSGSRTDTRCQIHIRLANCSPIIVTGIAADITSAIDVATSRVTKAVNRVVSRAKYIPHVTMPLYIKKSHLAI